VYRKNSQRYLRRVATECQFVRLAELKRESFEKWLAGQDAAGMSARSRNAHREALVAFGNWCIETGRLLSNPFARLPKANQKADPRRPRRALDEDELSRLLCVARLRPLAEYGRETVRRERQESAGCKSWKRKPLTLETLNAAVDRAREALKDNPEFIERLELLGRERALVYKTLVLTGLRKGELASIRVSQAYLDGSMPFLDLAAADEKNRQGSQIPLGAGLAADLKEWLKEQGERLGSDATIAIHCQASKGLPADAPLLTVPMGLVKILDRDLRCAGIPKRDERGRTVDVHALRHTFATHLSKGRVAPRTAQAAMRHSTIELTMGVYTDPTLLDIQGALGVLPALPLDAEPSCVREAALRATGTMELRPSSLAPPLAPTGGFSGPIAPIGGKTDRRAGVPSDQQRFVATSCVVKKRAR
jgi:integrase